MWERSAKQWLGFFLDGSGIWSSVLVMLTKLAASSIYHRLPSSLKGKKQNQR